MMKKGEIYEGILEKVEYPNKGLVYVGAQKVTVNTAYRGRRYGLSSTRNVPAARKGVFWRFWKNLRWRQENRCAVFFRPAGAVGIRPCLMRASWK